MQQIELFVSCRSLKDSDVFSKSDPMVVLFEQKNNHFVELDRTEIVKNNLNPNFKKTFKIDYIFEQKQPIRFEVRDVDGKAHDNLGSVDTTVGTIFGAKNQTSVLNLTIGKGRIIVRCERIEEGNEFYHLKIAGKNLHNTALCCGKSNPFLRLLRERNDNTFIQVHETEVVGNNLNPIWSPFEIMTVKLASNVDKRIQIECLSQSGQTTKFIGDAFVTLQDLKTKKEIQLKNPKQNAGSLDLICESIIRPSFIDYIRGGMQLSLITAIDFTGSNGDPRYETSLHYINPYAPNQYQKAIMSVGEILLAYDYDKLVPCYGFGANIHYPQLNSQNRVQHCFPLSGTEFTTANGVQGIMELYNLALPNVQLSGPTYFGPILRETMKICVTNEDVYTIFLILTDGDIQDMEETKQLLMESVRLPLSIIIIGIGDGDFELMHQLDGDNGLFVDGRKAERDLVQFVPIRDYSDQESLARAVLAEVPQQVVKYKMMIGQKPGVPVVMDLSQMGYTIDPLGMSGKQSFKGTASFQK